MTPTSVRKVQASSTPQSNERPLAPLQPHCAYMLAVGTDLSESSKRDKVQVIILSASALHIMLQREGGVQMGPCSSSYCRLRSDRPFADLSSKDNSYSCLCVGGAAKMAR